MSVCKNKDGCLSIDGVIEERINKRTIIVIMRHPSQYKAVVFYARLLLRIEEHSRKKAARVGVGADALSLLT